MKYFDLNTQQPIDARPIAMMIDGQLVISPTEDQYATRYVRFLEHSGDTPDGQRVAHVMYHDMGDHVAEERVYEDVPPPPPPPPELLAMAADFRYTLRKHFGEGAETNREVTATVVTNYFLTAPGLSVDDLRDGLKLERQFEKLAAYNGTGETWTFFEKHGGLMDDGE